MSLSQDQLHTLEIVERCASALSILGLAAIIVTFSFSAHFRNPINRLILFNAFYNIFDATLTMISLDGPRAGNTSGLCQFQAFLNQMHVQSLATLTLPAPSDLRLASVNLGLYRFPLADVLWTLAMAVDVFLIVFRRYDHADLRKLEIKYVVAITTFCFIPSFVFLFINTPEKGPFYGSVTLWCAIAPNWVIFRIVIYYVPIWSSIFVTMVLYCLVGAEIVKRRRALKSIASDSIPLDTVVSAEGPDRFNNTVVTTFQVDVESRHTNPVNSAVSSLASRCSASDRHPRNEHRLERPADRSNLSFRQYVIMPLMFFVVLLAIWVAPTTNRIASFIRPGFESFPLLIAVGAMGSLRGFWNGVVFITIGMKGRVRQKRFEKRRP